MARHKKINFKKHPINLAAQAYYVKNSYPCFEVRNNKLGLTCTGVLQPTPLSEQYKVKIEYKIGKSPKVFVVSPELKSRGDSRPPHIYGPNRPCIFLPNSNEWTSEKLVADTIIPWLSLWLFYYEVWLATGDWMGGGIHPNRKDD